MPWWRLAESVPEVVRGLANQLGWALLVGALAGGLSGNAMLFWFGAGFGVSFGLQGWPSGQHGGAIAWRATLVGLAALVCSAFFQPWIGAAVALGLGVLVFLGYGRRMGLVACGTGLAAAGLVGLVGTTNASMVMFGAFLAFTAGLAYWLVFAGLRQRPSRIRLAVRGTLRPAVRRSPR
jgi:hypothetical protein